MRQALLLDRDGVINVDHAYVHRPDQVQFVPGIFDLCRAAHTAGWLLIVVTNQAGIGRGLYGEPDFHALMAWMSERFLREGCPLAEVYFCPTHPVHGLGAYKVESVRRKPGPGMILEAARDHDLDLASCALIGDKLSDIEAGVAAGVGRNLLLCVEPAVGSITSAVVVGSLDVARQLLFDPAPGVPGLSG